MSLHYKNREVSLPFIMQYYPNLKSQPVGAQGLRPKLSLCPKRGYIQNVLKPLPLPELIFPNPTLLNCCFDAEDESPIPKYREHW